MSSSFVSLAVCDFRQSLAASSSAAVKQSFLLWATDLFALAPNGTCIFSAEDSAVLFEFCVQLIRTPNSAENAKEDSAAACDVDRQLLGLLLELCGVLRMEAIGDALFAEMTHFLLRLANSPQLATEETGIVAFFGDWLHVCAIVMSRATQKLTSHELAKVIAVLHEKRLFDCETLAASVFEFLAACIVRFPHIFTANIAKWHESIGVYNCSPQSKHTKSSVHFNSHAVNFVIELALVGGVCNELLDARIQNMQRLSEALFGGVEGCPSVRPVAATCSVPSQTFVSGALSNESLSGMRLILTLFHHEAHFLQRLLAKGVTVRFDALIDVFCGLLLVDAAGIRPATSGARIPTAAFSLLKTLVLPQLHFVCLRALEGVLHRTAASFGAVTLCDRIVNTLQHVAQKAAPRSTMQQAVVRAQTALLPLLQRCDEDEAVCEAVQQAYAQAAVLVAAGDAPLSTFERFVPFACVREALWSVALNTAASFHVSAGHNAEKRRDVTQLLVKLLHATKDAAMAARLLPLMDRICGRLDVDGSLRDALHSAVVPKRNPFELLTFDTKTTPILAKPASFYASSSLALDDAIEEASSAADCSDQNIPANSLHHSTEQEMEDLLDIPQISLE